MQTNPNGISKIFRAFTLAAIALAGAAPASAQDNYPSRTIKIIVPFPPGTAPDYLARLIGDKLAARWGQSVIVENRAGATGNIGAEAVAKAEPDGYTLLAAPAPPIAINQSLFPKLPFDPGAFVPVTVIATAPNVLVAYAKTPASTLQELIAYARANPDRLSYASPGNGSTQHLTTEQFKALAGTRIVHIPYKGIAPAFTDLLAGRVDMMFAILADALPHIRSGQLMALAIGSPNPAAELPGVPTLSMTFPGFISDAWIAVVAPPRTSREIAQRLSTAIAEVLQLPDVAKKLQDRSFTAVGGSPEHTAAFIKQETARWRNVIVSAGVKLD